MKSIFNLFKKSSAPVQQNQDIGDNDTRTAEQMLEDMLATPSAPTNQAMQSQVVQPEVMQSEQVTTENQAEENQLEEGQLEEWQASEEDAAEFEAVPEEVAAIEEEMAAESVATAAVATEVGESGKTLQELFEELSAQIQLDLDEGGEALAMAEEKTVKVAEADPTSPNYKQMVEEVKALQAKAGAAFKRAENMINTTNELLPKKNAA